MPALNPQAAATLCISFCKYQLSWHTLHDDYQMPVSTSWLERRVKNLRAMEPGWDWTESRSNDWHRPPLSVPIPYRLWRRRTCSCCRQRHCRSRCRGNCCTVDTFNSCEQVCSSKKRSGGTPETTLRQRFLNNLGLHTHTQFLASHTSPLHRPWQKFGMEETSVQRGFNIATTIHNTGTNCTAHMQLATRKLLSVATMMTRLC